MWNFLGISKGWHTILQNFQRWKLVFSRIFKGKVTNIKLPEGGFQKSISTTPPVWIFFLNSPMDRWVSSKKSNYYFSSMAIETIPEKNSNREEDWGLEICWGYINKNLMCKLQRSIKKELAFPEVIKKVLVFGPRSSMGCNTIFPWLRGKASFCLGFLRIKWQA